MNDYHHRDLKRAILAAAMEALAERQPDLSLRALAHRVGVSPGAPYKHYRDRSSLIAAIIAAGFDRLRICVEQADLAASSRGQVVAQAVAYVEFAKACPALFRLMFGSPRTDPIAITAADAAYGVLAERIGRDDPEASLQSERALACWSLMHGLAILTIDGQIDDKGQSDAVVSQLFALTALGPVPQDKNPLD